MRDVTALTRSDSRAVARAHQQVAQGVWRLGTQDINWYLIEEAGKITVLDAGLPAYFDELPRALAEQGRTLDDVDAVVISHCHPDHVGSAAAVRAESGARVLVHDADIAALTSGRMKPPKISPSKIRPHLLRVLTHMLRSGLLKVPPVADASAFTDGEVLDVPGKPRVIHAPGHSPGSCAFLIADRRVLFSGDVLVTRSPYTGVGPPQLMPAGFSSDPVLSLESLQRLRGIDADVMLPGHGEPWTGGIREALRLARSRGVR